MPPRHHDRAVNLPIRRRDLVQLLPALFLVSSGCVAIAPVEPGRDLEAPKSVYLVGHGWHVGLVVKREQIAPGVWPESRELGLFRYLEVGWGDGEYYPAARGTPALALKAALRSTSSVLHVVAFDLPVDQYFPMSPIVEVSLSPRGFDALCRFVHDHYARDLSGRTILLGPGAYGHSAFYLARGRYHVFHNSNQWTARALQVAGCPIIVSLSLNSGAVLYQASGFGRVIRMPPASPDASVEPAGRAAACDDWATGSGQAPYAISGPRSARRSSLSRPEPSAAGS
jgi:uncharacterized protein (TIGR02117 family)